VLTVSKGVIGTWWGNTTDIPKGWVLCDGTHGTPDLRTKFIVSAGPGFPAGDTGGGSSHSHDFTGADHFHLIPFDAAFPSGVPYGAGTEIDPIAGTTQPKDNLPPFYALCYIMYIGPN